MKKNICFLLCLASSFLHGSQPLPVKESPYSLLDAQIQSTEELLAKQKALKEIFLLYLPLHDAYLLDMDNKELLLKTASLAKQALDVIQQERLTPLFNPSFISELTLFAKLAAKPSLPPPAL